MGKLSTGGLLAVYPPIFFDSSKPRNSHLRLTTLSEDLLHGDLVLAAVRPAGYESPGSSSGMYIVPS